MPHTPIANAMNDEQQRKRNLRLGLILGTVAIVFFVGFIVRMVVLSG